MQIACPDCSARFLVKPSAIGENGRRVKCTKCGSVWFQEPLEYHKKPAADVIQEAPENVEPIPQGGNLPTLHKTPSPLWHKLAFAASLLLLCFTASWRYGHNILHSAPWLSFYYNMMGVYSSEGVGVTDIKIQQIKGDDKKIKLVVYGKLVNQSEDSQRLPAVRISIFNQNEKRLANIMLKSDNSVLQPGETKDFANTIQRIPETATRVVLDVGDSLDLAMR